MLYLEYICYSVFHQQFVPREPSNSLEGILLWMMAQASRKDPQTMKVAELKYWLSQNSLSMKGKKADLVKRYSKSNTEIK